MTKNIKIALLVGLFFVLFIYVVNVFGSYFMPLEAANLNDGEIKNGKIIFFSWRPDSGLYILDKDGIKLFTKDAGIGRCSNDGNYFMHFYGENALAIRRIDNRKIEKIIEIPKEYAMVSFDWSLDGSKICFTSNTMEGVHDFSNLFVYDIDTAEIKQLTFFKGSTPWSITNPKWSPDGKKIVFECPKNIEKGDDGPPISIFTINSDGTDMKDMLLNSGVSSGGNPSWSPDGEKIVFITHYDGEKYNDVFIINVDGSNLKRLTNDPWQDKNPVFSPEGQQICYVSPRHDNIMFGSELFVVNIDGIGMARITPPYKRKDSSPLRQWATDDFPQWSK